MSFGELGRDFRARKVDVHQFAMIPRASIPRSSFRMMSQHKTTINASLLYPVYLQEVLPGDSFNVSMTAFVRLSTPIFPLLDNMQLESFFFFVPCRLVWKHWYEFMGQEDTPGASIAFSIPQVVSPVGGFAQFSIYDYFGLPCVGQVAGGNTISVSALPLRSYQLIWNEWFRDENLSTPGNVGSAGASGIAGGIGIGAMDDGPDGNNWYSINSTAKRHDYFTSCLPWTQKGTAGQIAAPIIGQATVKTSATALVTGSNANAMGLLSTTGATAGGTVWGIQASGVPAGGGTGMVSATATGATNTGNSMYPSNLYADMTSANVGILINSMRLSFQTQRLLERDARGGTRYTEIVRSHFGVVSPDMRLMRPEYLGGGKSPVNITPIPQTVPSTLQTASTNPPMGTLAAIGTGVMRHGFRQSFTEHGYILGLVCVRNDKIYQQGIRKLWSRLTRYDFYLPVFAMLGEQSVLNKEIYADGSANDALTFGYQERWAEYRYHPSFTSGYFRSTNTTPLDGWHLAQKFTSLPLLNNTFILDDLSVTIQRNLALAGAGNNQQFLCDFLFDQKCARPMPMYSVPGLIDHF